jgi:hypothetical protein
MKRKLKVKKTVIRSLSTARINGGIIGGWNCHSDPYTCDAPCWLGATNDGDGTCPATNCVCDPHTYGRDTCDTCQTCPLP